MSILDNVTKQLHKEIADQVSIIYGCGALALYRYWNFDRDRILKVLEETESMWKYCSDIGQITIFKMLEDETGIEMTIPQTSKSWHELKVFNGKIKATPGQLCYIRKRQIPWIGAEVMSSLLLGLYRTENFSNKRLAEFMNKVVKIRDGFDFDKLEIIKQTYIETKIKLAGFEVFENTL